MILLDSNIVIYLVDPNLNTKIQNQLQDFRIYTCNIIVAEVLGYKNINETDSKYFEELLRKMRNQPFDAAVTNKVIDIRKNITIELSDAIIAATAIVNNLVLWTHNIRDFGKIPDLKTYDPITETD